MKYLDEYRDPELAARLLKSIRETVTRPWVIMEICGGQTHSILRNGIDKVLPQEIELVHGPGCPVCVTPIEIIDQAVAIACRPGVILTSFGDMLRVPGTSGDLLTARSRGADVRIVYSPLDALAMARSNPDRQVVFLAVGFETTTPHTAMAARQAAREGLNNFFLLVAHVMVPPAIEFLLSAPSNRVQAYLLAGHVCTVTGLGDYERIAARYRVPMVVTGFEPLDILAGVLGAVSQLERGEAHVDNRYARVVEAGGNASAKATVAEVYETVDRRWRGIGMIPASGLRLREPYRRFDAADVFRVNEMGSAESSVCISGLVLQGLKKPFECPAFGRECTPRTPLGATMVSSEGACAAYYAYHRRLEAGRI